MTKTTLSLNFPLAISICFLVILILFLSTYYINNDNDVEEKKDFCLYKNYTSYSNNYCYRIVGDVLIESPQVVECNSKTGYCFKIEYIRE